MQDKENKPMDRGDQRLGKEWRQPILMMEQEDSTLVSTSEDDTEIPGVSTRCHHTIDMFEGEG